MKPNQILLKPLIILKRLGLSTSQEPLLFGRGVGNISMPNLSKYGLDYEFKLLEREKYSEKVKSLIRGFVSDLGLKENISEERMIAYVQRLRVIARWIPEDFLDPDRDSIIKVLEKQSGFLRLLVYLSDKNEKTLTEILDGTDIPVHQLYSSIEKAKELGLVKTRVDKRKYPPRNTIMLTQRGASVAEKVRETAKLLL